MSIFPTISILLTSLGRLQPLLLDWRAMVSPLGFSVESLTLRPDHAPAFENLPAQLVGEGGRCSLLYIYRFIVLYEDKAY